MDALPTEILETIARILPPGDVARLICASKTSHRALSDILRADFATASALILAELRVANPAIVAAHAVALRLRAIQFTYENQDFFEISDDDYETILTALTDHFGPSWSHEIEEVYHWGNSELPLEYRLRMNAVILGIRTTICIDMTPEGVYGDTIHIDDPEGSCIDLADGYDPTTFHEKAFMQAYDKFDFVNPEL